MNSSPPAPLLRISRFLQSLIPLSNLTTHNEFTSVAPWGVAEMTKSLVFELLRSSDEASYTYNSKQHGGCPSIRAKALSIDTSPLPCFAAPLGSQRGGGPKL